MQNIYLISIGGAVMHNLALALHKSGYNVSGSDDEIFEPAKSRLEKAGLLPREMGWNADRIHKGIDTVILGMHARIDNPELVKAKELGLKIYSFPEYVFEHSRHKKRVVIGGSHGKTSTTSMIMHVLKTLGKDFDYLVGSIIDGFETMVKLSAAPVIVIEGDEYLSSAIDRRPKFHLYFPHVAVLTGIAWDHINVFPTFENYVDQFRIFIKQLEDGSPLAYDASDPEIVKLAEFEKDRLQLLPYAPLPAKVENGKTIIMQQGNEYPVKVFGRHNLLNMHAALLVCRELGVDDRSFFTAISGFTGAGKRLETLRETGDSVIYRDFAHSPSKLKATVEAVKSQYGDRKLLAVFELHTFSSLSRNFLPHYAGAMDQADEAIVYFNEHVFEWKKMPVLSEEEVRSAFGNVKVITDSGKLRETIQAAIKPGTNILLMSSGNFDNMDLNFQALPSS